MMTCSFMNPSYEKLCASEPITRCQPSTSTKSNIFKGTQTVAGGSMNMPIEVSSVATTMSTTSMGK
jgi:hypothetical protein